MGHGVEEEVQDEMETYKQNRGECWVVCVMKYCGYEVTGCHFRRGEAGDLHFTEWCLWRWLCKVELLHRLQRSPAALVHGKHCRDIKKLMKLL